MCTNGIDARARVCVSTFSSVRAAADDARTPGGFHLRIQVDANSCRRMRPHPTSRRNLGNSGNRTARLVSFRPTRRSTGRVDISRYFVNHRVTQHPKLERAPNSNSVPARGRSRGALGDGRCGRRLRTRSTTRGGGGDGPRRELQSAVNRCAECADTERCE